MSADVEAHPSPPQEPIEGRELDWPVVRRALAEHALTSLGAQRARALSPLPDVASVRAAHHAIAEWLLLEDEGVVVPLGGVEDVRKLLSRSMKGDVLEGKDLVSVATSLQCLADTERALSAEAERAPTLAELAGRVRLDVFLLEEIRYSFEPNGLLSPTKYPELAELRDAIQSLHQQVRSTLDGLVKGDSFGDLLQDRFWTVRDNRYVLPIKSHAKRWDLGIVHDTSGSGQTVFVEPHAVIELNNRLRLAEGKLRAAEHRILATLTRQLATVAGEALTSLAVAAELDLVAARAGLARSLQATRPIVERAGRIQLRKGRHPVLALRGIDVVANDLAITDAKPVLVLSGPNAGGKTVALKTIGLCALLVQHGCFVPAEEGSRVDLFDAILAAIGDQQTVEADLSSFSAHLVTLKEMVDGAAPHQLVLLDEVASGTDPAQGAAIAQAVLEFLADRDARVVVTTHFAPLKGLSAVDDRFAIAAVQYSEGRPSYRVISGATGESHALSIARRMGLPNALLRRADDLLGEGQGGLRITLEALDAQRSELDATHQRLQALEEKLSNERRGLARREEALRTRSKALEAKGAKTYLDRLKKAETAVSQVVASLQANPSHAGVKAARQTLKALSALAPTEAPRPTPTASSDAPLVAGDRVRLLRLGKHGEVVGVGGGGIQVRTGGLVVKAKRKDLDRIGGALPPEPVRGKATFNVVERDPALFEAARHDGNTLDLRGERVDDALAQCDTFFDRMSLRGLDVVFLLHGHGTGALKQALRVELRNNRYVTDFSPASQEQGGDAFTVCALG